MADDLVVVQLRHGPFWNFSYLVGGRGGDGVVIDPAWDMDAISAAAEAHDLRLRYAVVTHGHHDHAQGLPEAIRRWGAEALVHRADARLLAREAGVQATAVEDGHELRLGGHRMRLLHTPGHTPGSLSLHVQGRVFTGDTLMVGHLGRHGREDGADELLWHSVGEVLGRLAPETLVYPGHDAGPLPFAPLRDALPGDKASELKDRSARPG